MKKIFSLVFIIALLTSFLVGCGSPSSPSTGSDNPGESDNWPNKTVNIVMTHGAGGDTDYNARLMAKYLEEYFGVPFVVTNITGGNGSIAMTQVKDSKPDNYNFMMSNTAALSGNEASGLVDFGYDAFDTVAIYGKQSGETIIVNSSSPYKTLDEIIKASQENPNTIKLGISMGGAVYAASVMLEQSGAQFTIVDSGDGADRMASLLGGHVDITIVPFLTAREYIENGDITPLATLMSTRSAGMPNVPTAVEAGADKLIVDTMYNMMAPKGTDPAVIEKLNAAILEIVSNNDDYGSNYLEFNYQEPWALSVEDSIAELKNQRNHFMEFSQYMQ